MADDDAPISRGDFDRLARGLEELRAAQEDLREAATPARREEARSDVRDSEREFRRLARQHGLDDDDIAAALKAKRKRELRELLDEVNAESEGNDPGDEEGEEEADGAKPEKVTSLRDAAAKRQAGKKVKAAPSPPDDEPSEGTAEKSWASRLFGA